MSRKPTPTETYRIKRPPRGISDDDWAMTPDSVRRFIASLLKPKEPKSNLPFPTWLVLFLNAVTVYVVGVALDNRVTLPCVTPYQVSTLSVALVALMVFHLIWRNVYPLIPEEAEGIFEFSGIKIPLSIFINILNAFHPWKLTSRLLGILLLIFLVAAAFLNLSPYSPFYKMGEPFVIQSFVIQRLSLPSLEQVAPGETLTMTAGERAIVEVVLPSDTQVSCTWFTAAGTNNARTGCSIVYSAPTSGTADNLTVSVQPAPACRSPQESASLYIAVQQ